MKMKADIQKMLSDNQNILRSNRFFVLIIIFITALSFSTAINNEFTSWDDNYYVVNNRYIKDFLERRYHEALDRKNRYGGYPSDTYILYA